MHKITWKKKSISRIKYHDGFIDGQSKFSIEELMGSVILHDKRRFIKGRFPSYEFNTLKETKSAALRLLNGEKIISTSSKINDLQTKIMNAVKETDALLKKLNKLEKLGKL